MSEAELINLANSLLDAYFAAGGDVYEGQRDRLMEVVDPDEVMSQEEAMAIVDAYCDRFADERDEQLIADYEASDMAYYDDEA